MMKMCGGRVKLSISQFKYKEEELKKKKNAVEAGSEVNSYQLARFDSSFSLKNGKL